MSAPPIGTGSTPSTAAAAATGRRSRGGHCECVRDFAFEPELLFVRRHSFVDDTATATGRQRAILSDAAAPLPAAAFSFGNVARTFEHPPPTCRLHAPFEIPIIVTPRSSPPSSPTLSQTHSQYPVFYGSAMLDDIVEDADESSSGYGDVDTPPTTVHPGRESVLDMVSIQSVCVCV